MKRSALLIVTALTLLLTGALLARGRGDGPSRRESASPSKSRHGFTDEAIIRYRQGQPTHWRACLLQQ